MRQVILGESHRSAEQRSNTQLHPIPLIRRMFLHVF